MHIVRSNITSALQAFMDSEQTQVCILYGPRQAGKTTLLKQLAQEMAWGWKTFYFSFDDDIVPRQFVDLEEFLSWMLLKYGFDPAQQHLLCLNETQYSHKLEDILYAYGKMNNARAKIVATGIIWPSNLIDPHVCCLPVMPLSFHEFLDYRGIRTDHITVQTTSKLVLKELQKMYDEYLLRGGYPQVIAAESQEEKLAKLKVIMQAVYEKDIGFFFNGHDILQFEPMLHLAYHATKTVYKISTLAKFAECASSLVEQYMRFFADHHLIDLLDYSITTPQAKEIHHQKKLLFTDTGMMTYLTKDMTTKLTSLRYQMSFLYRELRDHPAVRAITTYKKINGSVIDLIIELKTGGLIVVCCSHDQKTTLPKVVPSYISAMGDRVVGVIKTAWLVNQLSEVTIWASAVPFIVTQPFLVHEAVRLLAARQTVDLVG